jgi:hypothetical protein
MTDADLAEPDAEEMPLIPPGTVPRAVVGFHAAFALGALGLAALSFRQGAVAQTVIMTAIAGMILAAGIAAGRLVARQ